jgi:hypothetical protein
MEEADRKSGGYPVIIVVVAAILLAVGAVVIVLIAKLNKGKKWLLRHMLTGAIGRKPSRRFCQAAALCSGKTANSVANADIAYHKGQCEKQAPTSIRAEIGD